MKLTTQDTDYVVKEVNEKVSTLVDKHNKDIDKKLEVCKKLVLEKTLKITQDFLNKFHCIEDINLRINKHYLENNKISIHYESKNVDIHLCMDIKDLGLSKKDLDYMLNTLNLDRKYNITYGKRDLAKYFIIAQNETIAREEHLNYLNAMIATIIIDIKKELDL